MRKFIFYTFFLLPFMYAENSIGQTLKTHFDSIYNKDPKLYNGIIFTDIYTRSVAGTQFFEENSFRRNDLGLKTGDFQEQYINYDVYSQKLLLTYLDDNYAQKMIEIPIENIRYFTLGGRSFEVLTGPDGSYRIYQVYQYNKGKILIYWMKYMKKNSNNAYAYRFSDIQKQIWLKINDDFFRVKNNKDLIEYINLTQKNELQAYLKTNKFKIQKEDQVKMQEFINYINTL